MHQEIELLHHFPRGQIRVALLDFDGTVSLIRQGWQDVMVSFMVDVLQELNSRESETELRLLVSDFVSHLTGKQTVYQMIRLAEEVKKRGGTAKDPLDYKQRYHDRLWGKIENRIADLRSQRADPQDWMVAGALDLLHSLQARSVKMFLASGTDAHYVMEESRLLGILPFFESQVYGAVDEYWTFSKRILIQEIVSRERLTGPDFVSFGDGYVEIQNTKEVGGIAVGVASEEKLRKGIDGWKRRRLIESGADMIVGDFRCHEALVGYLFGDWELAC